VTEPQIQVQGLCRFSSACTGGFKKYHGSVHERWAAMYAPARLRERTVWFDHVRLPVIGAQNAPISSCTSCWAIFSPNPSGRSCLS